MSLSASAIVCTHNRGAQLARTILSLLRCDREHEFEIVVVDNASTDDTAAVVSGLIERHSDRQLRYVREEHLGLHHARHAGARAARSALLLYTDDDVDVDPGWIRAYVEAFEAHPEMPAAGGPAFPRWEADPPAWVKDIMSSGWACLPLSLIDRGPDFALDPGEHFFGLNMAIRADALGRYGGFRPELIKSAAVGSGEWGLLLAIREGNAPVGWVPDARVFHRIGASRLEPRYFERWGRMESAARMFERWHGVPRDAASLGAELARIVRANWRSWVRAAAVRPAPDARAIALRGQALKGYYEAAYLWKIIANPQIRTYLDTERFGP